MFLAQLEYSKEGQVDEDEDGYGPGGTMTRGGFHKLWEIYSQNLSLPPVFDPAGTLVATEVDLDKSNIVQQHAFKGEPDDEDYSGPTGNEGVTSTYFYRRACIVLLPRSRKVEFLFEANLKSDTGLKTWVESIFQSLSKAPGDPRLEADLEVLCDLIVNRNQRNRGKAPMGRTYYSWEQPRPLPDTTNSTASLISLRLGKVDVFETVVAAAHNMLEFSVYEGLGKAIAEEGLAKWQTGLEAAFSCIKDISSHNEAMLQVKKGFHSVENPKDATDLAALNNNICQALVSKLDSINLLRFKDAEPLLRMAYSIGVDALEGPVANFLEKRAGNVHFCMAFLSCLNEAVEIDKGVCHRVLTDVHDRLAANFSFSKAFRKEKSTDAEAKRRSHYLLSNLVHRMPPVKQSAGGDDHGEVQKKIKSFVAFLEKSLSWGLSDNVYKIMENIAEETSRTEVEDFGQTFIPFLRSCSKTSLKQEPPYKPMALKIVTAYTEQYVGTEPAKPQNWARSPAGDNCRNCNFLSHWLLDSKQVQIRFEGIGQQPKKHLEGQLHRDHQCRTEHDRSVSPHALVITKTQSQWTRDHGNWTRRCTEAVKNIKGIAPKAELEEMLGDRYQPLLDLTMQRLPANAPKKEPPSDPMTTVTRHTPNAGRPAAFYNRDVNTVNGGSNAPSARTPLWSTDPNNLNRPLPPVAGVKRPHSQLDIVDLT